MGIHKKKIKYVNVKNKIRAKENLSAKMTSMSKEMLEYSYEHSKAIQEKK